MSQVIEVRFMNPATKEVLYDGFIQVSAHEASPHQAAIEIALQAWSGNAGVLREMEPLADGRWTPAGANSCWQYWYRCLLADDEMQDRLLHAVLFTSYKERNAA